LNNAGFKAQLQQLGVAQADLARAGSIANPLLSIARLSSGETTELGMSLEFNLLNLLLLPRQKELAEYEFERARLEAAQQILDLSFEVRQAWYEAVASAQQAELQQTVMQAAETASRLAYRQLLAGTGSKRDQARKQLFFNKAKQAWIIAQAEHQVAKEKLNQLLGFTADSSAWNLPSHLPDLPAQRPQLEGVEQRLLNQRLDVQAAEITHQQRLQQQGISRAESLLDDAAVGVEVERSSTEETKRGPALSLHLPVSDNGSAARYRASAQLRQSEWELEAVRAQALAQVRASYVLLQARFDVAHRQRQVVLPLNKLILEETQLLYNGMLGGVYDLLEERQNEVSAAAEYIQMLKEFWMADAELNHVLGERNHVNVQ